MLSLTQNQFEEMLNTIQRRNDELLRILAQRDALAIALRDAVESLKRLRDVTGAYRVTCIMQAEKVLAELDKGLADNTRKEG